MGITDLAKFTHIISPLLNITEGYIEFHISKLAHQVSRLSGSLLERLHPSPWNVCYFEPPRDGCSSSIARRMGR